MSLNAKAVFRQKRLFYYAETFLLLKLRQQVIIFFTIELDIGSTV